MISFFDLLSIPDVLRGLLLTLSVILLVSFFITNVDFGIFKIPDLKPSQRRASLFFGTGLLIACMLAGYPFFSGADDSGPTPSLQKRIVKDRMPPVEELQRLPQITTESPVLDFKDPIVIPAERISVPVGKYYADAVNFSPDGRLIAISDYDWNVSVYFAESGLIAAKFQGHEGRVFSIGFSPDGNLIATGSSDGTVRIWSVEQKREIRRFRDSAENSSGSEFLTTRVAFAPDGKHIAFTGRNHVVEIVRVGDRSTVGRYETQQPLRKSSADRDAACKYPTSPSPECIRASRAARDRLTRDSNSRNSARAPVEDIAFSADGRLIATVSHGQDSDVQIFDWKTEKFQRRINFRGRNGLNPRALAFSPSKRQMAVIGEREVGNRATKKFIELVVFKLPYRSDQGFAYRANLPSAYPFPPVDFSSDGRMVAFPIGSGFVIYDIDSKIEVRKFEDNCSHRHVRLTGGSSVRLATNFCDGNGMTITPLSKL